MVAPYESFLQRRNSQTSPSRIISWRGVGSCGHSLRAGVFAAKVNGVPADLSHVLRKDATWNHSRSFLPKDATSIVIAVHTSWPRPYKKSFPRHR